MKTKESRIRSPPLSRQYVLRYDEKRDMMYLYLSEGRYVLVPFSYVFPKWEDSSSSQRLEREIKGEMTLRSKIHPADYEKIFERFSLYFV